MKQYQKVTPGLVGGLAQDLILEICAKDEVLTQGYGYGCGENPGAITSSDKEQKHS